MKRPKKLTKPKLIAMLKENNNSPTELGKALAVSKVTIHNWMNALGVEMKVRYS